MRKRLRGRARQEGVYPVIMTGPDSFILHGQEYTGKPSIAGRLGEDDRAFVAFRGIGRRLPVIFAKATQGSDQRNSPFASILYGLWDCPEGGPWIAWGASAAQPAIDWDGSETLSQSIDRILSGGGTFEYANQKTRTEPTGLVRYTVGGSEFFAVVWGKYLTYNALTGQWNFRVRNLTAGTWLAAPYNFSSGMARQEGPVLGEFLPVRREGFLFHSQSTGGLHFLFLVFPGSSRRDAGGLFKVFPHDNPGAAWTYTLTPDAILDRPLPEGETEMPEDPDGLAPAPVERSGSIAVANMALLECYWSGWIDSENAEFADDSNSARGVLHLYKVNPESGGISNYSKSLRSLLDGALTGFSELLPCGIFDPNNLTISGSTAISGYQMQLAPSRWPYNPARNSFQFQVGLKIDQSGRLTPKALSAEIRVSDGELALLGSPRSPNQTIEEPYSGFLDAEATRLQSLIPEYIPGSYGYSFTTIFSSQPIRLRLPEEEACHYLEGFGDPENYPDQSQYYWNREGQIANVPEQFWAGYNTASLSLEAAIPVSGNIIQFPLPTKIGDNENPYYNPDLLPRRDNAGLNYGQVPSGIVVSGVAYTFELRPQRVAAEMTFEANEAYEGTRPDGIEETGNYPTYDDWDPDHLITNWERYEPCWVAISGMPLKIHGTTPLQGIYSRLETYYRSFLVITNGSTITEREVSCRFKLTGTTPRFDSYSAAFNIFQWASAGGILFLLRLWPSDWTSPTSAYSDMSAVRDKLEPHLELQDLATGEVLARQRLRPAADTGEAWDPVLNYAPHMLVGVKSDGKPWAHVWHEWIASGDTHPRHAVSQCIWGGEDGLAVSEDVSSSAERPTGRPSLPESYVSMAVDSSAYWIDDCQSIKVKSI